MRVDPLEYAAHLTAEDGGFSVEFPDAPGCVTWGETREEAKAYAAEALRGWLNSHLQLRRVPQVPRAKGGVRIEVEPVQAMKLQLLWERQRRALTQKQFGDLVGVSQQMVAKLEHPDYEPSLGNLRKVMAALGIHLSLGLTRVTPPRAPTRRRASPRRGEVAARA